MSNKKRNLLPAYGTMIVVIFFWILIDQINFRDSLARYLFDGGNGLNLSHLLSGDSTYMDSLPEPSRKYISELTFEIKGAVLIVIAGISAIISWIFQKR